MIESTRSNLSKHIQATHELWSAGEFYHTSLDLDTVAVSDSELSLGCPVPKLNKNLPT